MAGPKAAIEFIKAVARKLLAKPTKPGEGLTSIANRMQAEAKAGEIAETFNSSGLTIDKWDDFIKSEKDVLKYLNIIESSTPVTKEVSKDLIKVHGKKADVLDLTGKKIDTSKPILGGKNVELTHNEKIDWLVKNVDQNPINLEQQSIPPKPALEAMLKDGREDLIDHFFEMHTKKIGSKPKIDIDTSDLKHPGLVKKMMMDEKLKPTLVKTEAQIKKELEKQNKESIKRLKDKMKKDPEDLAGGGIAGMLGEPTYVDDNHRVPYGKGKLVDVARRKFLQLMGGAAAGAGAAKTGLFGLLKGGGKKEVIKELTSVPINNIEGMPAWFKPLVNQIIKKGDDVSTKFATGERKIVHVSELPDSKTRIFVEQDLTTGDVVVDIGMGKHGFKEGHLGQPVRLEYKAAEDIMSGPDGDELFKVGERDPHIKVKSRDEMTFDQKKYPDKKPEEFWVEEAEFTGGHPENIKFEETVSEKFGSHGSNFDEVEKFATGKVKKTKTTESRFLGKKYLSEGDDFASGGRVPLVKGKIVKGIMSLGKKKKPKKIVLSDDDFNVTQGLDDLENMRGTKASEIMRIKMKYPGISDDLIRKIMTDDNPQRKAEVFATMDEAFKMQEKGMGHEEIIETFKGTTRTKNASGGRASLSAGGLAGLLGE